ncbi:MAG: enoyl-CoA hydratase/isomerase family protein [Actinomycetota bacterium]|nr:enoyl-CoA hydratase/isomerase family protein [Actinomycetota bacterium]
MTTPEAGGRLVDVSLEGEVAVVTLRRPEKLNAISVAMERDLRDALAGPEVGSSRAVVVTGGERVFSSGADVTELAGRSPASVMAYYRDSGGVYEAVADLPQPTVSAISGYCLGGGLELALATDFRVAAADAIFGFPEVGSGIIPSSGGLLRLVRMVGTARARELVISRPRLDAPSAAGLGLLTEVVAASTSPLPRAMALAHQLAELPALAVELACRAIDAVSESSRGAALLVERLAYAALAGDHQP